MLSADLHGDCADHPRSTMSAPLHFVRRCRLRSCRLPHCDCTRRRPRALRDDGRLLPVHFGLRRRPSHIRRPKAWPSPPADRHGSDVDRPFEPVVPHASLGSCRPRPRPATRAMNTSHAFRGRSQDQVAGRPHSRSCLPRSRQSPHPWFHAFGARGRPSTACPCGLSRRTCRPRGRRWAAWEA